jgi:hypothetical protein
MSFEEAPAAEEVSTVKSEQAAGEPGFSSLTGSPHRHKSKGEN